MDNAQDIIQTALDILASPDREVELLVTPSEGFAFTRFGTLTGLGSMGDQATITVEHYRSTPDGPDIVARTLVDINEIVSLGLV